MHHSHTISKLRFLDSNSDACLLHKINKLTAHCGSCTNSCLLQWVTIATFYSNMTGIKCKSARDDKTICYSSMNAIFMPSDHYNSPQRPTFYAQLQLICHVNSTLTAPQVLVKSVKGGLNLNNIKIFLFPLVSCSSNVACSQSSVLLELLFHNILFPPLCGTVWQQHQL